MNDLLDETPLPPPTAPVWDIRRRGDCIAIAIHGPGEVTSVFVLKASHARDVGTAMVYLADG